MRIGINGFGRIGKCITRALFETNFPVELIQINSSCDIDTLIHLLEFDSVHGKFQGIIKKNDNSNFTINDIPITLSSCRDINKIKWQNIDILMECSGMIKTKHDTAPFLNNGVKKIIISAPIKDNDNIKTIIMGVNDKDLTKEDKIVSAGSCTTNCLAPIAKIIHDSFGIKSGFITTVHAYTNDQKNLDSKHKDLRRGRACALSMIPTSTGAAKTIGIVIPELKGKLDGSAIRVPTPNVSLIDAVFNVSKETTPEEINTIIKNNSNDILGYEEKPLVSVDFVHNSHSTILDASETYVMNKNLIRIISWYDNEWGFSLRMLDIAKNIY